MPRLSIDQQAVEVTPGSTILDAARQLGLLIPTLCFLKEYRPNTSCFVCIVKVKNRSGFTPSCTALAEDGMEVESETPEVHEARRTALELLLSDHLGDCLAPCHCTCPAGMNIPLMIRQIMSGGLHAAIATVKHDIALPAVLGRICSAPCERGCKRGEIDEAISICLLRRYAADRDLASASPYTPVCKAAKNKRVAIIGAGPAGLAAAYYLLQEGYSCTVFDDHDLPGGMLRYGVPEDRLPRTVLDAEIRTIEKLGVVFQMRTVIGRETSVLSLTQSFDAVLLATGASGRERLANSGLSFSTRGLEANRHTLETVVRGVFAGGDSVRELRSTVHAVADGKTAAASINQYLCGNPVIGVPKPFTTHIGRLKDEERAAFAKGASTAGRLVPASAGAAFSEAEAVAEARRCLHCDCRKQDHCGLRDCSAAYGARAHHYSHRTRLFTCFNEHPNVIYEPGKCIACGLCTQIAAAAKEPLGLTFVGRGFDVRVGVPFNEDMARALTQCAEACVAACPTGAIAFKD